MFPESSGTAINHTCLYVLAIHSQLAVSQSVSLVACHVVVSHALALGLKEQLFRDCFLEVDSQPSRYSGRTNTTTTPL